MHEEFLGDSATRRSRGLHEKRAGQYGHGTEQHGPSGGVGSDDHHERDDRHDHAGNVERHSDVD